MKPRIADKLEHLSQRLADLDAALSDPDVTSDIDRYRRFTCEHAELTPVIALYQAWCKARDDADGARAMLTDPDMKELAQAEIDQSASDMARLEADLQRALLPKDPDDGRNVFLEIRAGTGGDESALFAADLFRMYSRHAERCRWKVEIVSASESDLGGYREIIARVAGEGVYSRLKFESGGHRVQRVPVTETQGRIHTSACTVAVMAEVDEVAEVDINPADLRIDTFRASGAGGQHINKTDSAVRITHVPTGIVVECQDDRSQHRNKAQAMAVLAARIRDAQVRARDSQIASTRKSLVGSGDRSERIRTYNFPQGRITDHRINLTLYKIDAIMDGDLTELLDALAHEHQAEQLAQLAEEGV
ncbi:MAG: peptide chain release factor 1 [Pseudomonadota bacterium]|uniref:peptide chain release factor 1 n=1 Tax=Methyloversatilis sp. TaxID=2569862 RepID=UPI0027334A68|nr:peptide chain release factor 1 [Methyloversatilis sp.]MDP3872694.1 peptide chain release factor 1 [Methyloversatilis sp.]